MQIRVAQADDWQAVWVDGEKVFEHHAADWPTLLLQAGVDVTRVWAQDQCDELGGFPTLWAEVAPDGGGLLP